MFRTPLTLLLLLLLTGPAGLALASTVHHHLSPSPYVDFEDRAIKSLSENDMEELRRGGGWGLALPAELNGVAGG